jgi:DNA-binding transcriptional regulator YiaG
VSAEYEDFLHLLNQARLAQHLSVREAARVAGVPAATMQGWLNGRHVPTPALRPKFQSFACFLGISEDAIAQWWLTTRGQPIK